MFQQNNIWVIDIAHTGTTCNTYLFKIKVVFFLGNTNMQGLQKLLLEHQIDQPAPSDAPLVLLKT